MESRKNPVSSEERKKARLREEECGEGSDRERGVRDSGLVQVRVGDCAAAEWILSSFSWDATVHGVWQL